LKARAKAKLGLRNRIMVIPNFVDTDRFRKLPRSRALRREFRIPAGAAVVAHISNFAAIKNTLLIPEIARLVVRSHPKAVFLMVGERLGETGYDLEKLKKTVSGFGLDRHFRFIGRRTDIARILSISEATIMTSLNEGAPLAVLESLATGVPVVSSKVGGIPEFIKHGVNGFLVEGQNVEKYAEFILRLIQDHELRSKLARKAVETIHRKYSEEIVISRYLDLYRSVLERSPKSRRRRRPHHA
ncbi:MAG: glycosyltransferase, partial [bacterium]|nr:glycosyltransferase [bacterium]